MEKQILELLTKMNDEMQGINDQIQGMNDEMQGMKSEVNELKSEMHFRFDSVDAKLEGVGQ